MDALWLLEQVEAGGGRYVGIQPRRGAEALILFNDVQTGSTYSIPISSCTSEAVANVIERMRAKYGQPSMGS